jgi:hypothetical protein
MKSEVMGTYERMARPLVEQLTSPTLAGPDTKIVIDAKRAAQIGKTIEILVQLVDAQNALRHSERQLVRSLATTAALALALILIIVNAS